MYAPKFPASFVLAFVFVLIGLSFADQTCDAQTTSKDRYERYVDGILKHYDRDKDGELSKAEWSEMRNPMNKADANQDQILTKQELLKFINPAERRKSSIWPVKSSSASSSKEKKPNKKQAVAEPPEFAKIQLYFFSTSESAEIFSDLNGQSNRRVASLIKRLKADFALENFHQVGSQIVDRQNHTFQQNSSNRTIVETNSRNAAQRYQARGRNDQSEFRVKVKPEFAKAKLRLEVELAKQFELEPNDEGKQTSGIATMETVLHVKYGKAVVTTLIVDEMTWVMVALVDPS